MEAHRSLSRPASGRASARIHCKNQRFLHAQETHGGPSRPVEARLREGLREDSLQKLWVSARSKSVWRPVEARRGPPQGGPPRGFTIKTQGFCTFEKHMEARRGPSRPASGRASARIHCKNCGFLQGSLTWRPEGTRDFIILNKSHQGPPWTFGRRGSHVAEEPSRVLVLCASQVTWLSVSGGERERAAGWVGDHKDLYYTCVTYVHDYADPLRTCVL